MDNMFSKIALGVCAVSLAVIAYVQVNTHMQATTSPPQEVASLEPEDGFKPENVNGVQLSEEEYRRCKNRLAELRVTLDTLQDQIKSVPATMKEEKPENGAIQNFSQEVPNRLYEQVMLNIITTTTQVKTHEASCGM